MKKNYTVLIASLLFSSISAMKPVEQEHEFKKYELLKKAFSGYWVQQSMPHPKNFYASYSFQNQHLTFPIFDSSQPDPVKSPVFTFKDLPKNNTTFIPLGCFSPQEKFFAYTDYYAQKGLNIVIVDTGTGKINTTIKDIFPNERVGAFISYSYDGKYLVVIPHSNHPIKIFDVESTQEFRSFFTGDENLLSSYLSPSNVTSDFTLLAAGCANGVIVIWNIVSQEKMLLKGHTGIVFCVSFSPDNKYLASGSADRTIRIWDVKTQECIKVLENASTYGISTLGVATLAWHADGKHIAAEAGEGVIKIWNVETGICVQELSEFKGKGDSFFVQFSNNQLLAQYEWNIIGLWEQK